MARLRWGDGFVCAGHDHRATRTGSGRKAARVAPFKWVDTTLGNIKSAITGTCRKLGPDHAERYLASFAWRYNRRYQLQTMILRFLHSAARTQPIPYKNPITGRVSRTSRMRIAASGPLALERVARRGSFPGSRSWSAA